MATSIPASAIVNVTPNVLNAGGSALDLNGLMLSTSTRVPVGVVASFPTADAVSDYFGPSSDEFGAATVYFNSFDNSNVKPGALLISQYNETDVAAYLRSANLSNTTLVQLQALTGSLTVDIDGVPRIVSSVSLAAATSFSNAATLLTAAVAAVAPANASVTGSIGGIVTASCGATFTATGSGTNLTTTSTVGVIEIGAQLSGTGIPAGTIISSQTSGSTGGDGVYVTNNATTSSADAITATSNVLNVTAVASGSLQPTDVLSGAGVSTGTVILAQITGAIAGVGRYLIDSEQEFASTSVTSLSTVMKVTAVGSGTLEVGAPISGTGITVGTLITALGTGTGGTGTYVVSVAATTVSETITTTVVNPVVTYDSVSAAFIITSGTLGVDSAMAFATGTLATPLKFTSATGAVLSQGADAASPDVYMPALTAITQNWATFMTLFDPDGGSGNTIKEDFCDWVNSTDDRYAYACWDTDQSPAVTVPATASLGYLLEQADSSGTILINVLSDASGVEKAAFTCGVGASLNFEQVNGRTTYAFRRQTGMAPDVTSETVANNLIANGYNFYGSYATAHDDFIFLYPGQISGPFEWADSYIDQIWLNNAFQLALMTLLVNVNSIPYNSSGNALIEASLNDPINAGLNFGVFRPGVVLSQQQIAEVNNAAGKNIAATLQIRGWYLQVQNATPQVRAARGSPPCTFWYVDGQSVQKINLASIELQ